MKKIILSLLVFATVLVALPHLYAADEETGTLVVHFKNWSEDYDLLGTHTWGGIDPHAVHDGVDDFGATFIYEGLPVVASTSTETYGWIAVERPNGLAGDPNWDNKFTGDILINKTVVKANETVHVYVVQGSGNTTAEDPRYFVADNTKYNMFLIYFDPSGSYEENLGVHNWSGWSQEATGWNEPLKIFSTAGNTATGMAVKASMLTAAPTEENEVPGAGLLIYFGEGDGSKKTGDVTLQLSLGEGTHEPGAVGFAFVYSAGNGVITNTNLYYGNENFADFAYNAFSFRLLPYSVDATSGAANGTYAVRSNQVIVKTSAQLANPLKDEESELTEEQAKALVEGWFSVKEMTGEDTYGPALTIDRVDFAEGNDTIADFVIVLADGSELDITKDYVLFFDNDTDQTSIELDLDRNAPVITFPLLGEDKVIEVEWGKPFNLADFPLYDAVDDRDGDLTRAVFVPKGENSKLDTRTVGDYVITLQVSDAWGNVTQETFTFRVVKPEA